MKHSEHADGTHALYLTGEETDWFFDPFTDDMPSHLYYAGHRYIREGIYAWLIANIGESPLAIGQWSHEVTSTSTRRRRFVFRTKDQAMLFKLRWENSDGL